MLLTSHSKVKLVWLTSQTDPVQIANINFCTIQIWNCQYKFLFSYHKLTAERPLPYYTKNYAHHLLTYIACVLNKAKMYQNSTTRKQQRYQGKQHALSAAKNSLWKSNEAHSNRMCSTDYLQRRRQDFMEVVSNCARDILIVLIFIILHTKDMSRT